MQLKECFKNPEESEGEVDELLDDEGNMDQQIYMEADDISDISCDEDASGAGSDVSFEPHDSSDESESMSENEDDKPHSSNKSHNRNDEAKEYSIGREDGRGFSDDDDETVKSMIDAIKKPRDVPPAIELEDFVTKICFHHMHDIVALGTITGDVCLYRYENSGNTLLRNIEIHAKAVRDVQFSLDGRDILTCSKDKSIMMTDMETEKLKKFYETAHDDAINKLFVMDESLFVTGDDGGTVKLWDIRSKDPIFSLKEVEDYITSISTNESKKLLLVTSGDGYLTTLNVGARKLFVQSEPYEEELTSMGIYRGESKLLVGTSKGRLYSYNWGQFGYHCDMYPGMKTPISEMVPITDRIGCVAGEEGIIRAVHVAPFKNLGIVGQHNMPIESMDINWSGEIIASSSHNNDVRFWSVKYFEDFREIKYNDKHNNYKDRNHNLPSSRVNNAGDFFADLANGSDGNV